MGHIKKKKKKTFFFFKGRLAQQRARSEGLCTPVRSCSCRKPLLVLRQGSVVVQSLSHVQLFMTPWTAAHQAPLSLTISQSLPKFVSTESVMPANHLILSCPFLLLPSIFPSIRVFSSELALHIKWSEYWNFSISPSNEYSGLVSFRIDWFDLLAIHGKAVTASQQANRLQSTDLCLLHVDQTLLLKLIYK